MKVKSIIKNSRSCTSFYPACATLCFSIYYREGYFPLLFEGATIVEGEERREAKILVLKNVRKLGFDPEEYTAKIQLFLKFKG